MTAQLDVSDDLFLAERPGGALRVLQPTNGYRAGLDAVLLAAAAPLAANFVGRVLDAGAGVGVIALCLAARIPGATVTLVEREPSLLALARCNAERNGLSSRLEMINADLCAPAKSLRATGLHADSYQVVLANPPYLTEGEGRAASGPLKAAAHAMPAGALARWIQFLVRMAAPGGMLGMIHRADALPLVLRALDRRFGAIELMPVHPTATATANRVLVCAKKGSRAPLQLHGGLVVHDAANSFTPTLQAVLRSGSALPWPARGASATATGVS